MHILEPEMALFVLPNLCHQGEIGNTLNIDHGPLTMDH